jgi:hypothetical protein
MTFTQQDAYDRYQNGVTAADKSQLPNPSVLSQQFTDFMQDFNTPDAEDIDTSELGTTKYSKLVFFETLMSGTLHVQWGAYSPPAQGPGNVLMIQFRQTDSGYLLRYVGFDRVIERELDPDYFVLNSNSFEFRDGLVGVNIKRLNSKKHNGENLWVHELLRNGQLTRYYLLPYDVSD